MIAPEQRGSLYAILSGFLYGFLGYFGLSAVSEHLSITNMLFWRFLIASVALLIFLLPTLKNTRESPLNLFIAFSNGAIFYCFSTALFFFAARYIGSGLAMVIFFTYPIVVILYNCFFYGQKISTLYYFAIFSILGGMSLFVDFHEIELDLVGIFLGIISALCYAGYIIVGKKSRISPALSALLVSLGCMSTALIATLLNQTFFMPTSLQIWKNLVGIGLIATAIPLLLLLYSFNYISAQKASILSVLEPVFVVILGVLLLGETLTTRHLAGIIIVLTGALITLWPRKH